MRRQIIAGIIGIVAIFVGCLIGTRLERPGAPSAPPAYGYR